MKNKLLNKYLATSYAGGVMFLGLGGIAANYAVKEANLVQENHQNKQIVENGYFTHTLCLLVIVVSALMAGFCTVYYPKTVNKKVNSLTQKYLQNVFSRYPELKTFRPVLNDPKKLQKIAAIICNDLSKEEQNQILKIMDNIHNIDLEEVKKHAEKDILAVIKKHAEKNPEFLQKVLLCVSNEGAAFVSPTANQKTR